MLAKDVNIKHNDVPEGWSIEAADFINKVYKKVFTYSSNKILKLNSKLKIFEAIKEKKH